MNSNTTCVEFAYIDYRAVRFDYEEGDPIGIGKTKNEAVIDLLGQEREQKKKKRYAKYSIHWSCPKCSTANPVKLSVMKAKSAEVFYTCQQCKEVCRVELKKLSD